MSDDIAARARENAEQARDREAEIAARQWVAPSPEVGQGRELPKKPREKPPGWNRPEREQWWER